MIHAQMRLTANAEGPRTVTLMGREHRVFNAAMVQEQVLVNNLGRTFLPAEEIEASVAAWNGMPVVLNHPTRGGATISARDPEVLNSVGAGVVYGAAFADGRLTGNVYVPTDLIESNKQVRDIVDRVDNEGAAEVSTGFDARVTNMGGSFGGEQYDMRLGGIVPDHLALLTDQKGACSVQDGCGITNSSTWLDRLMARLRAKVTNVWNRERADRLMALARERFPGAEVFMEDVAPDAGMFAFTVWSEDEGEQLMLADFGEDDEGTMTMGEAVPGRVRRGFETMGSTDQVASDDSSTTNATGSEETMDRDQIVADLVANGCSVSEDVLNGLTDCALQAMHEDYAARNAGEGDGAGDGDDAQTAANQSGDVRELRAELAQLRNELAPFAEERARNRAATIAAIVNSRTSDFTTEELEALPHAQLQKLAKLTNTSHLLQGGPRVGTAQNEQEAGFMPVTNWLDADAPADSKEA